MTINLLTDRGTPLARQNFTWKDLVQKPIEERLLVTKLLFQLRVGRLMREKVGTPARKRGAA